DGVAPLLLRDRQLFLRRVAADVDLDVLHGRAAGPGRHRAGNRPELWRRVLVFVLWLVLCRGKRGAKHERREQLHCGLRWGAGNSISVGAPATIWISIMRDGSVTQRALEASPAGWVTMRYRPGRSPPKVNFPPASGNTTCTGCALLSASAAIRATANSCALAAPVSLPRIEPAAATSTGTGASFPPAERSSTVSDAR